MKQYSKILPTVLSNFLIAYCLEINRQNLFTKIRWIKLLTTFNQSKDLNRILDLFKSLKVNHKPTRFDKSHKSKALEKISRKIKNIRQDKWVGFYHKCHIFKMNICIVLIYRFLNLLNFQYF